jgi:hypothetical protein
MQKTGKAMSRSDGLCLYSRQRAARVDKAWMGSLRATPTTYSRSVASGPIDHASGFPRLFLNKQCAIVSVFQWRKRKELPAR